jgi:hypothetical protein
LLASVDNRLEVFLNIIQSCEYYKGCLSRDKPIRRVSYEVYRDSSKVRFRDFLRSIVAVLGIQSFARFGGREQGEGSPGNSEGSPGNKLKVLQTRRASDHPN